jgi:hypothetical protein
MYVRAVLIPVLIQVALTFGLMFMMAGLRARALRSGAVRASDVAVDAGKWPNRAMQVANAFRNQFELPVLFYLLVLLAIATRQADFLFVVLAWLFVVSRLVHAFVHVTYNRLSHRGAVFAVGGLTLLLMWIIYAVDVLIGI